MDYRSDEKLTPVHIAAAWGRVNILNILLKCGGDPTLRDDQGKTPLDYAKEEGHWDIVDQLENDLEPDTQYDKLQYDITLGMFLLYTRCVSKLLINTYILSIYEPVQTGKNAEVKFYCPKNDLKGISVLFT